MDKWHQVLGELRSIVIYLPVDRGLFYHMQEFFHHVNGKQVILMKGSHHDLADFCWIVEEIWEKPTLLYEMVTLTLFLYGYNNA